MGSCGAGCCAGRGRHAGSRSARSRTKPCGGSSLLPEPPHGLPAPHTGLACGNLQVKEAPGCVWGDAEPKSFRRTKNTSAARGSRAHGSAGPRAAPDCPQCPAPPPGGTTPGCCTCVGGPKPVGSQAWTLRRAEVTAPRAWSTTGALTQAQLGEELCHPGQAPAPLRAAVLRPCWSLGRPGTGYGANGVEKGQQGPGPSCAMLTGTSGRQLHVSMTKAGPAAPRSAPLGAASPGCGHKLQRGD